MSDIKLVIERLADWNYGAFLNKTDASCIAIGTTPEEALEKGKQVLATRTQPTEAQGDMNRSYKVGDKILVAATITGMSIENNEVWYDLKSPSDIAKSSILPSNERAFQAWADRAIRAEAELVTLKSSLFEARQALFSQGLAHADEINYYKDEVHDLSHKIDQLQQDNLKLMEYGTTLKASHADEIAKARSDGYDKAHSKWMVDYGIKCSQLAAAEADLATFKASHAKQSYFEWTEDSVRLFLKANSHSPNLMARILNDHANRLWVLAQQECSEELKASQQAEIEAEKNSAET